MKCLYNRTEMRFIWKRAIARRGPGFAPMTVLGLCMVLKPYQGIGQHLSHFCIDLSLALCRLGFIFDRRFFRGHFHLLLSASHFDFSLKFGRKSPAPAREGLRGYLVLLHQLCDRSAIEHLLDHLLFKILVKSAVAPQRYACCDCLQAVLASTRSRFIRFCFALFVFPDPCIEMGLVNVQGFGYFRHFLAAL